MAKVCTAAGKLQCSGNDLRVIGLSSANLLMAQDLVKKVIEVEPSVVATKVVNFRAIGIELCQHPPKLRACCVLESLKSISKPGNCARAV